jgi:intergrase/recombinase
LLRKRIAELKSQIEKGGLLECTVRGLIYIGMSRGKVDERGVRALRQIRLAEDSPRMTLAQFKTMAREQYFLMLLDPEGALSAIPSLLPASTDERQKALAAIRQVLSASGEISGEAAERLKRVVTLFETSGPALASPTTANLPFATVERAKAS